MNGLKEYLVNILDNLIGYTTPTAWTIIVLVVILFRKYIINLIVMIGYKIFKVEEDYTKSNTGKVLKRYIIWIGLYIISKIWIKDSEYLKTAKIIFEAITILVATKAFIGLIEPEGPITNISKKSRNEKLASYGNNKLINNFIFKIIKIVLYIIAFTLILNTLGYNVNGLVAGLGIGSALIALAVQDFVKSLISGASILAEKPFIIGDYIRIPDGSEPIEGTVEDITLRNTKVRLINNSLAHVPNSKITTTAVTNFNKIENRRIDFKLHFPLEISTVKLNRIISKIKMYLENNPKVLEKTVFVGFTEINIYSNTVRIFCYVNESKFARYLDIQEEINFEIMKILDSENTELATPTQTLAVRNQEELRLLKEETENQENNV